MGYRDDDAERMWKPVVGIVGFLALVGVLLGIPLQESCQNDRQYERIVKNTDFAFALADARRRSGEAGYEPIALQSVRADGVDEAGVPHLRGEHKLVFQFCPSLKASCGDEVEYHEKVETLRNSRWSLVSPSHHCGACSPNHTQPRCTFAEVRRRTNVPTKLARLTWQSADPPYWEVVPYEKEYRVIKIADDCR
jgi:hypothetical protein